MNLISIWPIVWFLVSVLALYAIFSMIVVSHVIVEYRHELLQAFIKEFQRQLAVIKHYYDLFMRWVRNDP